MAGAPFWGGVSPQGSTFSGDPWDVVFIGGDPLPGICEISGIAQLEVDKKKAKGRNGVTLTVTGYQPGPFEVKCSVWTQAQWDFLQAWLDKFWIEQQKQNPVGGRTPQVAMAIDHPACSVVGITTAIIQGVSMPEAASAEGVKVVKIKMIDGRASEKKTVVKTARGSATNAKLAKPVTFGKADVPPAPSTERADLGPTGPRAAAAGGSD